MIDQHVQASFWKRKMQCLKEDKLWANYSLDKYTYGILFYWSMVDLQCRPSFRHTAQWFAYTYAYTSLSDSFLCCYKLMSIVPCDGIPLNSGIPKTHGRKYSLKIWSWIDMCATKTGRKASGGHVYNFLCRRAILFIEFHLLLTSHFPCLFVSMSLHSVSRENSWTHPQQKGHFRYMKTILLPFLCCVE